MLKKVFCIMGILVALGLAGFAVFMVLVKKGVIELPKDEIETNVVTYKDGEYIYTESKWRWNPIESRMVLTYVDTSSTIKQKVNLHLTSNKYYQITIPYGEYIYDYGKTLWAEDGSYMIRVVGDATLTNLSALAGIDNGEPLTQTTICSKEDTKGCKTIATIVDSYAIIAKVYDGDETYSVLRDSLQQNNKITSIDEVEYSKNYHRMDSLVYDGKYTAQVVFQDISLVQERYLFADGLLFITSDVNNINDVKDNYLIKLCQASNQKVDTSYARGGMFYAESGDYCLGLVSYNTNTTVVLLGEGEEAKCNIISVMNYLE